MHDKLHEVGFFRNRNKLRFFLAGRGALKSIQQYSDINIRPLPLTPFAFTTVRGAVQNYVLDNEYTNLQKEKILGIAASLMNITGGHPACIADILQELAESSFLQDEILKSQRERLLKEIVFPVLDSLEVYTSSHLLKIVEQLSVFRRFGSWLLKILIDQGEIQWDGDEYELEQALLSTTLLERDAGFIKNSISRRLFATRFRFKDEAYFQKLCQAGASIYPQYLGLNKHSYPIQLAAECIYQQLQYECYARQTRGKQLEQSILNALTSTMAILTQKRDPREVIPDYAEVLYKDWELEFIANYFLSESGYEPHLYRELIKRAVGDFNIAHNK